MITNILIGSLFEDLSHLLDTLDSLRDSNIIKDLPNDVVQRLALIQPLAKYCADHLPH